MPERPWYQIRNAADPDAAEVLIYDQIGENFWGEGLTAKTMLSELAGITAPNITLRINSPGGSVFDGVAIYNALVRHPAKVTTHVDGLAASIASVIALAGDEVHMAANALFMIHNPSGFAMGEAEDMRKLADLLDKIRDTMAATYAARCALTSDELVAAMDAETWYTAEEALEAGFATHVGEALRVAATYQLHGPGMPAFRNAPADLAARLRSAPTVPTAAAAAEVVTPPPTQEEEPMPETLAAAPTPPPAPALSMNSAESRRHALGRLLIAARNRDHNPAGFEAALSSVQAAAGGSQAPAGAPPTPGDGILNIPDDVKGVLPAPIVQEIHSWIHGQRPVSEIFGLRGLPFREGPSFTWPYVKEFPKADVQTVAGTAVYKTNIVIDGMPFTKVTIGAQLKVPFQAAWTSPDVVAEVAMLMVDGYADAFEQLVVADFISKVTAQVDLAANASSTDFRKAILKAHAEVKGVTRSRDAVIIASSDQWQYMAELEDGSKRPLYPRLNPTNASGEISTGDELIVEGLRVVEAITAPAGTLILGNPKGYKTFDDGSNFATQSDLTNLADDKVVYGFGAFGALDMAAFRKLAPKP